jgi:hypothetical protein
MDWPPAADQPFLPERYLLVWPRKAVLDVRGNQAPGGIAEPCLRKAMSELSPAEETKP